MYWYQISNYDTNVNISNIVCSSSILVKIYVNSIVTPGEIIQNQYLATEFGLRTTKAEDWLIIIIN